MPLDQGKPTMYMLLLLEKDLPMQSSSFYDPKGGYYVLAIFKYFWTRLLAQSLHGTPVGPPASCFTSLEENTV